MWEQGQATDHKDLSDQIRDILSEEHIATVVINAGGTGYAVDDIVTVAGGTVLHGLNATLRITAEAAGVITGVRVETGGAYTVAPTLVANAATGAGNDDATFDLTIEETGWTILIDETTFGPNNDYRVMLEGANGGVAGDEVYVGWQTFQSGSDPNDFYNIRAAFMTGYNNMLDFADQPGFFTAPYMNAQNKVAYPIDYWIQATDRYFTVVCKPENASITMYAYMSMGLFDPFATQDEFPYPIYVAGGSARNVAFWTTNSNEDGVLSGIAGLINYRGVNFPLYMRDPSGTVNGFSNREYTSSQAHTQETDRCSFPCGEVNVSTLSGVDDIVDVNFNGLPIARFAHPQSNSKDNAPQYTIMPMPDSPDDLRLMWPLVLGERPALGDEIWGEIPGAFWTVGTGLNSEDEVVAANDDRYKVFLGGRRTQIWSWFALKEA